MRSVLHHRPLPTTALVPVAASACVWATVAERVDAHVGTWSQVTTH